MGKPRKDSWDKIQVIGVSLLSVLIPLAVAFVGNEYAAAIKGSENKVKYTEIAVKILNGTPTDGNKSIRDWAIAILNLYSGVPVNDDTRKELLESPLFDWSNLGSYASPDIKTGERAVEFKVSEHKEDGRYVDSEAEFHLSSGDIQYADEDIYEGFSSVGLTATKILLVGERLKGDFLNISVKEYNLNGEEIAVGGDRVYVKNGFAIFSYTTKDIKQTEKPIKRIRERTNGANGERGQAKPTN